MGKSRTFTNTTKIPQVYYNKSGDPITLKPGQTYTEDLTGMFNYGEFVTKEIEKKRVEDDVEELKAVKRVIALIKVTRTLEDLEKFEKDEKRPQVIEAIFDKKKELVDATNRIGTSV